LPRPSDLFLRGYAKKDLNYLTFFFVFWFFCVKWKLLNFSRQRIFQLSEVLVLCDTRQCYLSRFKRPCGSPFEQKKICPNPFFFPPFLHVLIFCCYSLPHPYCLLSLSYSRNYFFDFSIFLQDQTLDEDQIRNISKK